MLMHRRRLTSGSFPLIAAILIAATPTIAAPSGAQSQARPRVGLVLSGGGARGAAHIGVLKVLEELRVPVDCIVGTSVGAVIGGLYASGLSAESLENNLSEVDWADLFTDRPPRTQISFRRKQDDHQALFRFELGVGPGGLVLPSGLVAGQKLSFLLRNMALHTAGTDDFDHLPIPFRAVAADLDTGEIVVLERGDLVEAIRASMAVPGAFTPVELDGRTLVDGGLVRNLAVDVLRSMDVDVVIAVEVSTRLDDQRKDSSIVGVATQTLMMLTDKNIEEQLALIGESDILIDPDLEGIGVTEFDRFRELIAIGEAAARKAAPELDRLAVPHKTFLEWIARHRRGVGELQIDSVEVAPGSRVDSRIIEKRVHTRPGLLDMDLLRADLERVYRIGEFQQVDFQIDSDAGATRLVIDARDKSWGPHYVRAGIALEADFRGEGDFTVLADYMRTHLNRLGAEWKNRIKIGRTNSILSEFYQPLDFSGFWFVAPQFEALRGESQSFSHGRNLGLGDSEGLLGRIDAGAQFGRYGEIRFGLERGYYQSDDLSGPLPEKIDAQLGRFRTRLTFDQLDNAGFPRRGTLARGEFVLSRGRLGADDDYEWASLQLTQALSHGPNTWVGRARLGSDLGSDLPAYAEFPLGGFLKLSGLETGRLQGNVLGHASLTYYRQVGTLPGPLGGGVYLGGSFEIGNVWEDTASAEFGDLRPAGLIFAGADTVLGPVYLGYGRTDGAESSFYLVVGQVF